MIAEFPTVLALDIPTDYGLLKGVEFTVIAQIGNPSSEFFVLMAQDRIVLVQRRSDRKFYEIEEIDLIKLINIALNKKIDVFSPTRVIFKDIAIDEHKSVRVLAVDEDQTEARAAHERDFDIYG